MAPDAGGSEAPPAVVPKLRRSYRDQPHLIGHEPTGSVAAAICLGVRGRHGRDDETGRDDYPRDGVPRLSDSRGISRAHGSRDGARKDRSQQSERPSQSRHAVHRLSRPPGDAIPNTQEVPVAAGTSRAGVRGAPKGIRTPDLHLERVAS